MKNSTLLLCLLGLTSIASKAQPVPTFEQGVGTGTIRFLNMAANTYNVLEGNPYLPINFQEGAVLLAGTNTKWFSGYKLRLNTYSGQLEVIEFGVMKTVTPNEVKGFKIGESVYLSGFPTVEKLGKNAYFQVLHVGKVTFLKNTITYMKEVRAFDDVKQGDKFDTYVYYYILENEIMTKVFPNKKALLKAIPSAKLAAVEGFVNNKNLRFKEEKDFIETMKFYDSL